ncbi:hypothetical protein PCAR4_290021 [Paraburkholderia caribensis]|nr:hypothetical protein PCAR4_290021 [Paraburkholderia caribensis]
MSAGSASKHSPHPSKRTKRKLPQFAIGTRPETPGPETVHSLHGCNALSQPDRALNISAPLANDTAKSRVSLNVSLGKYQLYAS